MPSDKAVALYLRLAMRVGLASQDDVERWADSLVARHPTVTYPVTELCMARRLSRSAVDELLGEFPGSVDRFLPARMLMALVRRRLLTGQLPGRHAASVICAVAQVGDLPDDEASLADWLDDQYWLAESGTQGTVAAADEDLKEFLERFATYEAGLPAA